MRKFRVWGIVIGPLILFSACRTIQPLAPSSTRAMIVPIQSESSDISVPIELDLKPYLLEAEKQVPRSYTGKEEQCDGLSVYYSFNRQSIQYAGKANALNYSVNGALRLKLSYCPQCVYLMGAEGNCIIPRVVVSCGYDEPLRKFKVDYSTKIKVNSNFTLDASTALKNFEMLDPCEFTIANIDVTDRVEEEVSQQLITLGKEIDEQIEAVDVKSFAKDAWKTLSEPIEIEKFGKLWLNPSAIGLGEIKLNDTRVSFPLNLEFAPVLSSEPLKIPPRPLPNLTNLEPQKGLDFSLDTKMSFDSLSSIATQLISGKPFVVKRKKILIDRVDITGSNDHRIILKLLFSGFQRGTLYVLAEPFLNDSLQTLEFRRLDFDVETRNVLLKSAKWLFHARILEKMQQYAVFDYSKGLMEVKKEINRSLNQEITEGVKMEGGVTNLRPTLLQFNDQEFLLRTRILGKMKLIIN